MRGDYQNIKNSALKAFTKLISFKKQILIILILDLKILNISSTILMTVWVNEGKLYTFYIFRKIKMEF